MGKQHKHGKDCAKHKKSSFHKCKILGETKCFPTIGNSINLEGTLKRKKRFLVSIFTDFSKKKYGFQ
jgi:hypothetical protein